MSPLLDHAEVYVAEICVYTASALTLPLSIFEGDYCLGC